MTKVPYDKSEVIYREYRVDYNQELVFRTAGSSDRNAQDAFLYELPDAESVSDRDGV